MSALRRTWSSPYFLEQAQTLEQIQAEMQGTSFVPMDRALPQIKRLRVKGQDRVLLGNGQISHDLRTQLIAIFQPDQDHYVQVLDQESGQLIALIQLEEGRGFVLRRVFKY